MGCSILSISVWAYVVYFGIDLDLAVLGNSLIWDCTYLGSINILHITVVDDLAVLARSYGSQQIKIRDVENNTCRKKYCINPVKSSTLLYPVNKGSDNECKDIFMVGDKIPNDSNTSHLGIYRDITEYLNIEENISTGRKTAYPLMGAGFHSGNGLKVCLNEFIMSTSVLPRLIYGLEVILLRKTYFEMLLKLDSHPFWCRLGVISWTINVHN